MSYFGFHTVSIGHRLCEITFELINSNKSSETTHNSLHNSHNSLHIILHSIVMRLADILSLYINVAFKQSLQNVKLNTKQMAREKEKPHGERDKTAVATERL